MEVDEVDSAAPQIDDIDEAFSTNEPEASEPVAEIPQGNEGETDELAPSPIPSGAMAPRFEALTPKTDDEWQGIQDQPTQVEQSSSEGDLAALREVVVKLQEDANHTGGLGCVGLMHISLMCFDQKNCNMMKPYTTWEHVSQN